MWLSRAAAGVLLACTAALLASCGDTTFSGDTSCREYRQSASDPELVAARIAFEGELVAEHPPSAEIADLQTEEAGTLLSHLGDWCAERPDDTLAQATQGALRLHGDAVRTASTSSVPGVDGVRRLLAGIPQDGDGMLGKPDAPITLAVFIGVDCSFCSRWLQDELPRLIESAVRPGKARLWLLPSSVVPTPVTAAATGELADWIARHVGWQAALVLAEHRGDEGTEWFTPELQDLLMSELSPMVPKQEAPVSVPLETTAALRERADALAKRLDVSSLPSFVYGPTNEEPTTYQAVPVGPNGQPDFARALAG